MSVAPPHCKSGDSSYSEVSIANMFLGAELQRSLIYLSASVLPSPAANSVHVMKMSDAFAASGLCTTLVGVAGGQVKESSLRVAYGVSDNFIIRLIPQSRMVDYRIRYAFDIFFGSWAPKDALIYTRVPKIAAFAAHLSRPCVLELHHPPSSGNEASVRKHLQSRTGGSLVVITHALKEWAINTLGVAANKVLVAHDGADIFPSDIKPAMPPLGKCRVGYLGHLYPGKGMEIIVQLAPRIPELEFVVVGGRSEDVTRWKCKTAGISNLRFVGQVPHAETPAWLRSFDIALLPNQRSVGTSGSGTDIGRWTSPLKCFEYMAAGLPIIASDLENLREVLTHEETALLCPPDAVDAWETALRELSSDEVLRKKLGTEAANVLAKKYTWIERARALSNGLGISF